MKRDRTFFQVAGTTEKELALRAASQEQTVVKIRREKPWRAAAADHWRTGLCGDCQQTIVLFPKPKLLLQCQV